VESSRDPPSPERFRRQDNVVAARQPSSARERERLEPTPEPRLRRKRMAPDSRIVGAVVHNPIDVDDRPVS
jgi:hypothetical protein